MYQRGLQNLTEDGYRGNFGFGDYNVRSARNLVVNEPGTSSLRSSFLEPLATVCKEFQTAAGTSGDGKCHPERGLWGSSMRRLPRPKLQGSLLTELMEKKLQAARDMGFRSHRKWSKEDPGGKGKEQTDQKGADAVGSWLGNTKANTQAAELQEGAGRTDSHVCRRLSRLRRSNWIPMRSITAEWN